MFDSHIHTKYSSDSDMSIEEVVKRMRELNMGAVITEHMDLKFPIKNKFIFDVEEYFKNYSNYRNNNFLLGIEMGMKMDCIEESNRLQQKYEFDYVIGSVHLVNNIDIYVEEFYRGRSKKEVYESYFNEMIKCLKVYNFIDSLGHIDYIARYARYEDKELYYSEYSEFLDEILKLIIDKGIVLELNTRRLNNSFSTKNLIEIYKRYNELGGKYVVLGSDAHRKENIANYFKTASEMIETCNLKSVYFKERKMQYC
ncbi:histidinol phosphate phosphatase [Haloimpatiens sp. FM7330]|uniref:histidinol phosphate phosphatase n=1 Tax=Haloimpatiens sp. FM7330 TaxID=3298610 RepID=UPI00362D4202